MRLSARHTPCLAAARAESTRRRVVAPDPCVPAATARGVAGLGAPGRGPGLPAGAPLRRRSGPPAAGVRLARASGHARLSEHRPRLRAPALPVVSPGHGRGAHVQVAPVPLLCERSGHGAGHPPRGPGLAAEPAVSPVGVHVSGGSRADPGLRCVAPEFDGIRRAQGALPVPTRPFAPPPRASCTRPVRGPSSGSSVIQTIYVFSCTFMYSASMGCSRPRRTSPARPFAPCRRRLAPRCRRWWRM